MTTTREPRAETGTVYWAAVTEIGVPILRGSFHGIRVDCGPQSEYELGRVYTTAEDANGQALREEMPKRKWVDSDRDLKVARIIPLSIPGGRITYADEHHVYADRSESGNYVPACDCGWRSQSGYHGSEWYASAYSARSEAISEHLQRI